MVLIFSFSYGFFLFLLVGFEFSRQTKIYFVGSKIYLVFPEHKKEKLFSSEKEKIGIPDLYGIPFMDKFAG